jgi:regulator of sigma E protease
VTETGFDFMGFLEQFWLIFQVIFGIGLMIFIHELGHFLAAKKVGVRVEAFSLGFGPRLLGFRKGGTDYKLSAIPLGGYVKMAGENPGEERTGAPDELYNRTPFERMLVFSAGVFMNFLFAFITIPIIFAVGIPFIVPEIGQVVPGGPAWHAGLQPGDRILEVNGNSVYQFSDIHVNIALGKKDGNEILIERDGRRFTVDIVSEKDERLGLYQIRITPPTRYEVSVTKGSPAERAGLLDGDRILSINGVPAENWSEQDLEAMEKVLRLKVERKDGAGAELIDLDLIPEERLAEDRPLIGIKPRYNLVEGIRGELSRFTGGLLAGDVILTMDGKDIHTREDYLSALETVEDEGVVFEVRRGKERRQVVYGPEWAENLEKDLAVLPNMETNCVALMKDGALSALDNPLVGNGMRILAVNGERTDTFEEISDRVQDASSDQFELTVVPAGESGDMASARVVKVTARPQQYMELGFDYLSALHVRKLNLTDAIAAGFHSSIYMIKTCYLTLSRILTGDVAGKNLGGIITIGRATYNFAELGLAKLFFFLAILSINLGFLNILPIPILDGGHLLFLLIEKIKGSPVNEKVMGYSQIVGLAFILALLIYVTYNDILRLIQ